MGTFSTRELLYVNLDTRNQFRIFKLFKILLFKLDLPFFLKFKIFNLFLKEYCIFLVYNTCYFLY